MDIGLTTLREEDISQYYDTVYSLLTRTSVLVARDEKSTTALAGTGRRFVSTVATTPTKRANSPKRPGVATPMRYPNRYDVEV